MSALLGACATSPPKSQLYQKFGSGSLSQGALRVRVRDCARRFPAQLEEAADEVGQGPLTPAQHQRLLEFKANGPPVLQSVLLQPDAVAALLDGWALLYQLRDSLVPAAANSQHMADAVRDIEAMAGELAALWGQLTGNPDTGPARARVAKWARAHPLHGSLLARDSPAPLLAGFMDRSNESLMKAAGSALEDVQDLITRVDLYAVSLPRQARWQAEAAVGDLTRSPAATAATIALQDAVALLEPLSRLADQTSTLVARERTAVLADLDRKTRGLEAFISSELSRERQAVFAGIAAERDATLRQTSTVMETLVDRASDRAIDRVFDRLSGLLWRVALVAAVFAVVLALLLILAWLLLTRPRRPEATPAPRRLTEREA